jgi:hypothetical protein
MTLVLGVVLDLDPLCPCGCKIIVVPYVANTDLLRLSEPLTLQSKRESTSHSNGSNGHDGLAFDFDLFYASGHDSGDAVRWAGCNRSLYRPLGEGLHNSQHNAVLLWGDPSCKGQLLAKYGCSTNERVQQVLDRSGQAGEQ